MIPVKIPSKGFQSRDSRSPLPHQPTMWTFVPRGFQECLHLKTVQNIQMRQTFPNMSKQSDFAALSDFYKLSDFLNFRSFRSLSLSVSFFDAGWTHLGPPAWKLAHAFALRAFSRSATMQKADAGSLLESLHGMLHGMLSYMKNQKGSGSFCSTSFACFFVFLGDIPKKQSRVEMWSRNLLHDLTKGRRQ